MELDENMLNKLKDFDNDKLKEGITNVAKMMGQDTEKLSPYLRDMDKIRKALAGITQKDLDKLTAKIGEDKMTEIAESIKKEIK